MTASRKGYVDSAALIEGPVERKGGKAQTVANDSEFLTHYAEIKASGLFDFEFYLSANPDVASAGIDLIEHYIRWGECEGRRPSKDFDPSAYLEANPDLGNNVRPFLHYARSGRIEDRPLSPVEAFGRRIGLNPGDIEASLRDPSIDLAGDDFKFQKQYAFGRKIGLAPKDIAAIMRDPARDPDFLAAANDPEFWSLYADVEASGLFDSEFYRSCLPVLDVKLDPLSHYLIRGYRSFQNPSLKFSSAEYYVLNPDVRDAHLNPLLHYIKYGRREQRLTSILEREKTRTRTASFAIGTDQREEIALECMRGTAYLCRYGLTLEKISSLKHAAQAIEDLAGRTPAFQIDAETPDATIIIPVYGQLQVLLNCLDSLAAQTSRYNAKVLVVDDASPPETAVGKIAAIPWLRYLRQDRNRGFIASCNAGASVARGRHLVFLNNDTRVVPGWLDELIGSFQVFPKAGLVGSKLINPDGSLQDAGGIVWRDGTVWNYGRGDDALRPEYCFARQVDYCSGASLAVLAEAWKQVGGFDRCYAPAYCEDTDLAFKLKGAGYETWIQPLSVVVHYEGLSHGRDESKDVKAYQRTNQEKFYLRWGDVLSGHGCPRPFAHEEANRSRRNRVLILDAQTPTPDRDSGSCNTDQLIRLFLHKGWHVSFAPRNHSFAGEYTKALQRLGVEMLIGPNICNIGDIIQNRPGGYDFIFAFRYESIADCFDILRTTYPTSRIVFHDIDLHYLRLQRKAELFADHSLRIQAQVIQDQELELFARADCSVVVTEAEKATIESQIPVRNIVVYPYTIDVRRSDRRFEDRRHLCFIGGYAHDPNVDAVIYFVREIWPLVQPKLFPETKFLIAGPGAPESIRSLATEDILVLGHVPDLSGLLDDCRLSVVPVRYGAGIKGKLVRTLAYGLPSVATTLAAEGMGLEFERHIVIGDTAESFAEATVRLFYDKELWRRLQEAGYAFAEERYSCKVGLDTCNRILDVADETWIARRVAARRNRLAQFVDSKRDGGNDAPDVSASTNTRLKKT